MVVYTLGGYAIYITASTNQDTNTTKINCLKYLRGRDIRSMHRTVPPSTPCI